MTRRRAVLAVAAAAIAVVVVGWPGAAGAPRTARTAPEVPAVEPAPAAKRPAEPRAVTRIAEMPRGEAVLRAELLDDPNRVPGPDLEIRGFVHRSGRPVEGALVRLCRGYPSDDPSPFAETRSLDDGSFVARAARRSSLALEVRHEGSATRRLFVVMPSSGDPEPVLIELAAGHELVVKVVEPEGAPVAGAPVVVRCAGGAAWPAPVRWSQTGLLATKGTAPRTELEARTDAHGRAAFKGIEAGAVSIDVAGVREHVVVPTGVEVAFVRERPGIVEGTLRCADGRVAAEAVLRIETVGFRDRLATAEARTGADGRFRIEGVPPGFVVRGLVDRSRPVDGPPVLLRPGGTIEWNPVLRPWLTVRGRTITHDGRPLATVRLALSNDDHGDDAWSDEDGHFELRVPEAGAYKLVAKSFGLLASADVTVPSQPIDVALLPCARVVGRIRGLPQPDRRYIGVTLEGAGVAREVTADATGRFAFEHVPPLRDARVVPGDSGPFDVPAGAVVRLDLDYRHRYRGNVIEAEHWGRLVGEVRDDEGRPVAGAVVTYPEYGFVDMKLTQPAWANTTATDDDGRYELRVAPSWLAMGHQVIVARPGFAPAESKPRLEMPQPQEARRLDFTLGGAAQLRGRVVDAAGKPIRYADIEAKHHNYSESTHTAHDGSFRFTRLAPGRHKIVLFADDVECRTIEADTGENEILITVPGGGGEISGIVAEGGRVPIVAISPFGRFETMTSDRGRFRFTGLPPGRYDVQIAEHEGVRDVPVGTDDLVLRLPPD